MVSTKLSKKNAKERNSDPETQPKAFRSQQRGAQKTLTNKTLTANPNWLCISLRTYSSPWRAGKNTYLYRIQIRVECGYCLSDETQEGRRIRPVLVGYLLFLKNLRVGYFLKFFWDHIGYQYQYKKLGYQKNFSNNCWLCIRVGYQIIS
jgi:hypothetical protein